MRADGKPDEIIRPAEEYSMPREIAYPAPECPAMTPETAELPPEYGDGGRRLQVRRGNTPRAERRELADVQQETVSAEESARRERSRKRQLIRSIMAPAAATVAIVAIIFASFRYDPLGFDYLNNEAPKSLGSVTPGSASPGSTVMLPVATPTVKPGDPTPSPTPKLLQGPQAISFATPVTWTMIHVTAPNGIVLDTSLTEGNPMGEVKSWLITWNGELEESSLVRERKFLGYYFSEDAIPVGDTDDLPNLYLAGGTMYEVYREDLYYNAVPCTSTPVFEEGDDTFPTMTNLEPDFNGDHTYGGQTEHFIRVVVPGESYYRHIVCGDYWLENGEQILDVPGASYDSSTNVLTLKNCRLSALEVNLMGNGFTVRLVGDNRIGSIKVWGWMYGGSLTLTGTGTLRVNEDYSKEIGLWLDGERSACALFIDRGINVDIYGDTAVLVGQTTMEKAIWFRSGTRMTGGKRANGPFGDYFMYEQDESGNLVQRLIRIDDVSEYYGMQLYDYSVADAEGNAATEVHFTDPER